MLLREAKLRDKKKDRKSKIIIWCDTTLEDILAAWMDAEERLKDWNLV
jgi:hypothetical protein